MNPETISLISLILNGLLSTGLIGVILTARQDRLKLDQQIREWNEGKEQRKKQSDAQVLDDASKAVSNVAALVNAQIEPITKRMAEQEERLKHAEDKEKTLLLKAEEQDRRILELESEQRHYRQLVSDIATELMFELTLGNGSVNVEKLRKIIEKLFKPSV